MVSAVGISTLDHLIVVDGFKSKEGTYLAKSYTTEGGGMASTALCAAARLGSKTRIFSKIGDDVNGKEILLGFERFSVDTKGIKVLHQAISFVSFVFIDESTGAGDAFHGAFCHFLAKNKPLEYCLDMASRTGALNCRDTGGRKALPTLEEINSFE